MNCDNITRQQKLLGSRKCFWEENKSFYLAFPGFGNASRGYYVLPACAAVTSWLCHGIRWVSPFQDCLILSLRQDLFVNFPPRIFFLAMQIGYFCHPGSLKPVCCPSQTMFMTSPPNDFPWGLANIYHFTYGPCGTLLVLIFEWIMWKSWFPQLNLSNLVVRMV